ncbi:hypothetical protein HUJ05_012348, partial [Dendroctonus ponderosae]
SKAVNYESHWRLCERLSAADGHSTAFQKLHSEELHQSVTFLLASLSFSLICNPIVWFLLKTSFNVLTEVFIYMVLGACSFLISLITHVDEYYTKGRDQMRKYQTNADAKTEVTRSGVHIQNCTIKRFLEKPYDS